MPREDDLYKALIEESKLYREKVATIWLQKFSMLGAIIVFAATRSETASKNPSLIAAAILSLPVIAVLLDIKLAEFGIHANVIDHNDRRLVRLRSIATVAVTVIPTCIIAFLSQLAAAPYVGGTAYSNLRIGVVVFCMVYLAVGLLSIPMVLFRRYEG